MIKHFNKWFLNPYVFILNMMLLAYMLCKSYAQSINCDYFIFGPDIFFILFQTHYILNVFFYKIYKNPLSLDNPRKILRFCITNTIKILLLYYVYCRATTAIYYFLFGNPTNNAKAILTEIIFLFAINFPYNTLNIFLPLVIINNRDKDIIDILKINLDLFKSNFFKYFYICSIMSIISTLSFIYTIFLEEYPLLIIPYLLGFIHFLYFQIFKLFKNET